MSIRINIPPLLQQLANNKEEVFVEGNTIGECVDELLKLFPNSRELLFDKHGKLHEYILVYLNGTSCYPEELSKPVNDWDVLDLLFIISGG